MPQAQESTAEGTAPPPHPLDGLWPRRGGHVGATGRADGGRELSRLGTGTRCLYPHATQHQGAGLPQTRGQESTWESGPQTAENRDANKHSYMQVHSSGKGKQTRIHQRLNEQTNVVHHPEEWHSAIKGKRFCHTLHGTQMSLKTSTELSDRYGCRGPQVVNVILFLGKRIRKPNSWFHGWGWGWGFTLCALGTALGDEYVLKLEKGNGHTTL